MDALRVLLVDDEPDFTEVLAERMNARGLKVEICSSGPEALECAAQKVYDAVILDLAMPGMDGLQTLRRLLAGNPDLQVILLTGRATLEHGLEAMRTGAMEFFEKPPDIEKLIEKVTEARSRRERLSEERMEKTLQDLLRTKGW
jgi:DNA-binding NtrC family response regulator